MYPLTSPRGGDPASPRPSLLSLLFIQCSFYRSESRSATELLSNNKPERKSRNDSTNGFDITQLLGDVERFPSFTMSHITHTHTHTHTHTYVGYTSHTHYSLRHISDTVMSVLSMCHSERICFCTKMMKLRPVVVCRSQTHNEPTHRGTTSLKALII